MNAKAGEPRFLLAGDGALVVEFGDTIDRAISERVLALAADVRTIDPAITEAVPTFRSLLVQYDPLRTSAGEIEAKIMKRVVGTPAPREAARRWRLPACYDDPTLAPDLADVAKSAKMTSIEVVRLHSSTRFHVYVVGFLPGFAYLGDLPAALTLPRRKDPRTRVPPGSVGIALGLTGVYPVESPGGWHLIANCPVTFFDAHATEPSLLSPGDEVLFEPISRSTFDMIKRDIGRGAYTPPSEARA